MFRYLPVRTLCTGLRLNENFRNDQKFNFVKSFEYLTRSKKYEQYLGANDSNDLSKYDHEISRKYKDSSHFVSFKDYDHLELKSKIMLCDSINSKYLEEYTQDRSEAIRNFRKFFDSFFRDKFKLLLRQRFKRTIEYKESFLLSIDPELHLKMLYYYGNFYYCGELDGYETSFLQEYMAMATSLNYNYDLFEMMTILHSVFKLNLKLNSVTLKKFVDTFKQSNDQDQQIMFYSIVRMIRQQDYFDENLIISIKEILKKNHRNMNSAALVNILASLASFAYYDKDAIEIVERSIYRRDDLRLKDVTKLLWSSVFFDYDFNKNPQFLRFILTKLRSCSTYRYRQRTNDAIDAIKSLILCNVYDLEIFNFFLTDPLIRQDLLSPNRRTKLNSDLFFIIKSLAIEKPNYQIDYALKQAAIPISKDLKTELENREDFNDFIKFLTANLNCKFEYEFVYPLPHYNISSIFLTYTENGEKNSILIDLIDRTNTMRNDVNRPKIYFKAKLRQLQVKGMSFVLYRRSGNSFVKV